MQESEILTTNMVNTNSIKETKKHFLDLGYEVDLFKEFFIISGILVAKEEISFFSVTSDLIKRYSVKEKDEEEFINIHTYYYTLITNFYVYLLNEDRADEPESVLIEKMNGLSSTLFHQLPLTLRPGSLLKSIESIIPALFMVFESYGLAIDSKDFLGEVEKKMDANIYEKVEHFFMIMTQFSKECKKQKRVTKEMTHNVKMLIMSFIVICWDILICHEEA